MTISTAGALAADQSQGRPASALVADDDPTSRLLVRAALEGDLAIVDAENGLEAVQALEAQPFDIAIVDLDMPVMDGFGVIQRARARAETRHLPIIVVTGRDDIVAIERAFALGATSFLSKPINWNIFRHQVGYVMQVARVERETRAAKEQAERLATFRERGLHALEHEIRVVVEQVRALGPDLRPAASGGLGAAAQRIKSVLGRIRRISEILTGGAGFDPERVGSAELARDALAKIRDHMGSEAVDQVEVHVPGNLDLYCDRELAAEALKEVLENALAHSPPGQRVRLSAVAAPQDRIRFEIEDRGPGIPEHVLESGLSGFRPGRAGSRPAMGLGFGLPATESIVQAHGGHLGVMSEPGVGTEVFLSFPSAEGKNGDETVSGAVQIAAGRFAAREKAAVG